MKIANTLWRDLLRQVRLLPLAALFNALPLTAQVPSLINYQGRLTDAQGQPVTGNRTMAVRIYDAASGGNMTYSETIGTVAVGNGTYSFRFGSGGAVVVSANETIATTNGTHQVFSGTVQGTPSSGTPSLSDGAYTWTASGGSSNPSAFGATYNGTARSFQIIYYSQVPMAGRAIVASYETTEAETIDASLANGEAYLALSVNGTEESTRTRLLAVPYALQAKESADAQALVPQVSSLSGNLTSMQSQTSALSSNVSALSLNFTALSNQSSAMSGNVSALVSRFRVLELSGNLSFGNSSTSRQLIISNTGFDRLTVSGISYPAGFSGNWSGVVPVGSLQAVAVTFSPSAAQSYSGNITVSSDATGGGAVFPVSGTGARLISVSGNLVFGNVTVNTTVTRNFTISNTGTMNLTVSEITYPSRFSGNWSGTIPSGGSQSVDVTFTPNAVQAYSGGVSMSSSADGVSGILAVSGVGVAAGFNMITVQGGTLQQPSELVGQQVATFQIGKYEVTWDEWQEARTWAVANGYTDLANVGAESSNPKPGMGNHPVQEVNWYDALKWSNARSEREGLMPVYSVNGTVYRTGQTVPQVNSGANGYRLPTEAEWEWAAHGGVSSQGYTYSGSNNLEAVAWTTQDDQDSRPVGTKAANELGIHDMSGNLCEWTWDIAYNTGRMFRGGGFWYCYDSSYFPVSNRLGWVNYGDDFSRKFDPTGRWVSLGFRLARSSGN